VALARCAVLQALTWTWMSQQSQIWGFKTPRCREGNGADKEVGWTGLHPDASGDGAAASRLGGTELALQRVGPTGSLPQDQLPPAAGKLPVHAAAPREASAPPLPARCWLPTVQLLQYH